MVYPAIVYSREHIEAIYADDNIYNFHRSYQVTVIDKDPDSEIVDKMLKLPMCRHDSNFTADNLNHDTFTIYY